jgi:hypothetical protein
VIELVRLQFGEEVLVLLVQLEQALGGLGPGDGLVEVLELRGLGRGKSSGYLGGGGEWM